MTEAYQVLKNENSRKEYEQELAFFRENGHFRWQLRYRVYPRTNVYVVIVCFLLVTMAMQVPSFFFCCPCFSVVICSGSRSGRIICA